MLGAMRQSAKVLSERKKWVVSAAVGGLLLIMLIESALCTLQRSPSWDEGDHIYSGYMNWKQGEYGLNPEHPPLVKLVATFPLLSLDLKVAPRHGENFKEEAYMGGRELIFRNDPRYGGHYSADQILFRVHMAALVFGLLLGGVIFAAGRQMFGSSVGLIALTLFVFDPSFLAHATFVTTDVGASCGYLASVYFFYRFIVQKNWQRALCCGLVVGLAFTTKHSMIVLPAVIVLLAVAEILREWIAARRLPWKEMTRTALGILLAGVVAWAVVWAVYSFRFQMTAANVSYPSLEKEMRGLSAPMRGFILTGMHYHLLPYSYLFGLADVQKVGNGWPTFFLGEIHQHGLPIYFPALLSAKWTLGTLALLLLSAGVYVTGKMRQGRELIFLGVPLVFFLGIAIASPLNLGVRHVLPAVPFVFLLIAAGVGWLVRRHRIWLYAVCLLLVAHAADSLHAFPYYLPYGNALWGGSAQMNQYFSDSAVDWAEQLIWTRQWIDQHQVKECYFAYFADPYLLPSDYGIPCKSLPTFDSRSKMDIDLPPVVHGPVLVSMGDLNGYEFGTRVRNPYQNLNLRKPDAVIAHSIAVFYGDVELPGAAAMAPTSRSRSALKKHPELALQEARKAVALEPRGFDANRALSEALAANGDRSGAMAALAVAKGRIPEMEPEAQLFWIPALDKAEKALANTH